MSDNTETNPTQAEVSSSEQLVGFVPVQAEEHNPIGVQLIEGDEDFFGSQAIELNGERHVIVSQAQDPETGELLLVLRGENGEHIAIQPEALSSMVQASGGDNIQVAVESTEASLTLASDISSLSQSSDLTSLASTLSALPPIIASIPSQTQTQTSTAPTNVVQAIETPRVSQEEQPSTLTTVTEPVTTTPAQEKNDPPIAPSSLKEDSPIEKPEETKQEEPILDKIDEKSIPIDTNEPPKQKEVDNTKNEEIPGSTTESNKTTEVIETKDEVKPKEVEAKVTEVKAETEAIPDSSENKSETTETIETGNQNDASESKESDVEAKASTPSSSQKISNGLLSTTLTPETESTSISEESLQTTSSSVTPLTAVSSELETTPTPTPSITTSDEKPEKNAKASDSTSDMGFGNTAVIQVQDSNTDASLEQLMANAVLTSDGNYVLMAQTEDGQVTLPPELNLSDVINAGAGGQTFLIETPEGLVACTAAPSGEDGAIQLIPAEAGDIENAVISSAQSVGVENQIIQAISGGQTMSYTLNSSTGCLELAPVSTTQTPSPASTTKSRGNRNTRPSKSKVIPAVPAGQTLLLSTDSSISENPTISTKPVTTPAARNRNTNSRSKGSRTAGGLDSTVNSNDVTIASSIEQIKSNAKTTAEAKSTISLSSNISSDLGAPPGPSQLAASRRTYSKKSNIVWITPDASQGANTTAFATVATASVKHNIPQPQKQRASNSSVTKPTVQTTPTQSPVKNTASKPITASRSSSPSKITLSSLSATSPAQTKTIVQSSPTTVTISRSSDIKSTPKSGAEKGKTQAVPAADKSKSTATKTSGTPMPTKAVTASKTMVTMKTSSPANSSKSHSQSLMIESSISKGEILTKTPIRMSDITSPKAGSASTPPKATATKTVVTVGSVKDKAGATKVVASKSESTPSAKTVVTSQSNKTSSTKPTVVSTSKSTPNTSTKFTSVKPTPTVTPIPEKNAINEKVKPITAGVQKAVDSTKSDTSDNKNKLSDKSKKLPEKTVSTRHSSRLSPSKSTKAETASNETNKETKETDSKVEVSEKVSKSVPKVNEVKETPKSKPEVAKEDQIQKTNDGSVKESTLTPQKQETMVDKESKVNDANEGNKSSRKSRRSSRNTTNVEETKKEVKPVEEIKAIENKEPKEKIKDSKEIKEKVKEVKEKAVTENVSTRRTSGRQRATKGVAQEEKKEDKKEEKEPEAVASEPQTEQPPQTIAETPIQGAKPGRVTRGSSGKKPEPKAVKLNEQVSKTPEVKSEEPEKKSESDNKIVSEASKIEEIPDKSKLDKEKVVETNEKIALSGVTDTPSVTRSVKKRVQFEVREKSEDKEKVTEEKQEKVKETSTPISTRRSLRSATPYTKSDNDSIVNQKEDSDKSLDKKIDNDNEDNDNKTPQRASTRKRKEVAKSVEPEVKPTKTPKRTPRKSDVVNQNDEFNAEASPASPSKLRDRKSKITKRVEPRLKGYGSRDSNRNSIDGSETFTRSPRKQSIVQSYIDENEWQEKEADLRQKTISSLSDLRSPNECYDYSTNECSFYVRHQSLSVNPKQSAGNYLCQKCGFHTTRINNLVIHHKDQCTYIKNAVIQQWQSDRAEMHAKRTRPADVSQADSAAAEAKRQRTEDLNHLDKHTDESEIESEDERHEDTTTNIDKPNQTPTISDIDAMLMASDDEDLLSIDNLPNPKREFGFAADDIVWVETNNTHWPALVSKVFSKEKKALIRLIDSPWPKKSLKVSTSSISLFDSAEVNKQYLRDGPKTGSTGDNLVKALQKAEEFLRKKCLGSEVTATMFFDSESDTNVEDDERLSSIHKEDVPKETSNAVKEPVLENSGSIAIESNGDELEVDKMPESSEAVAQWKEKRRQQNAKLLQCIKDGKVETHLLGVYSGTIASERHQKFLSGSESEKNQLKHVPWFGPIDDEEQQEEIYDYCSQLFKSNFKTDGSFDTVAYIFEVWVPEAIVKAISRVRRIELKDSESIFAKGVILSKSEKDELTKEIRKEAEKQMTSQTTSD